MEEKKIKILKKGDVMKVGHVFQCSHTTVNSAMRLVSNSEICKAIRAYIRDPKNEIPYVEY